MRRPKGHHPGSPHPLKPWLPDTPGHQNNRVNHHIKDHLDEQIDRLRQDLGIISPEADLEISPSSGERKG